MNSLFDVIFSWHSGHLKSLCFSSKLSCNKNTNYISDQNLSHLAGLTCFSEIFSSSRCLAEKEGGGDMLSSLDGGVVGSELGLEGTAGLRPLARNCWWSRPGRKGLGGITCILSVSWRYLD